MDFDIRWPLMFYSSTFDTIIRKENDMITINFIRHAQTKGNASGLITGQTDTPLSKEGIKEVKQFIDEGFYPDADLVFASDLSRAVDTANIIYPKNNIVISEVLRETNFGPFENVLIREGIEPFYKLFMRDIQHGNMETYSSLKERAEKGLKMVLEALREENKTTASVIAHGGLLRMMHHIFTETPVDVYRDTNFSNGRGFIVSFDNDYNFLDLKLI